MPILQRMLPKLGINRNMKRDVRNIWTEHELGGLNFTDLKVEQLAQHVHRLLVGLVWFAGCLRERFRRPSSHCGLWSGL